MAGARSSTPHREEKFIELDQVAEGLGFKSRLTESRLVPVRFDVPEASIAFRQASCVSVSQAGARMSAAGFVHEYRRGDQASCETIPEAGPVWRKLAVVL
jgi:hypothetical protein